MSKHLLVMSAAIALMGAPAFAQTASSGAAVSGTAPGATAPSSTSVTGSTSATGPASAATPAAPAADAGAIGERARCSGTEPQFVRRGDRLCRGGGRDRC